MVKYGKYRPAKFVNFVYICITRVKSYHFCAKVAAKMVPARNTNTYKFANFAGLYFPYFTTFRHQTLQSY